MVNIPKWKIILIIAVSVLGFLYALPNALSPSSQEWLKANVPGILPSKTINLGLDLRGGAHLLYEVDVDVVFKERADMLLQDARSEFRKKKVGYSRIGTIPFGMRLTLRDAADAEKARSILRAAYPDINIASLADSKALEATLNEKAKQDIYRQTISQSIEIVRRRIDELGTTEPIIQRQGDNRILIQAPGANATELKNIIGTTAKLTFHLVSDVQDGSSSGSKVLPYANEKPARKVAVDRRALITGEMLSNAQPNFQDGRSVISFRLNNVGARRFCDVTRKNIQKPFAIVLDDEVISAPTIQSAICGGQGVITGGFTVKTANDLAMLLRAGALPAPMHVVEERTVGPSLGADSIEAGKTASLIGLAFVLVFMIVTYGTFGILANLALIVNVALIFAILSGLQATLTLPGIAGIVLTIGMAVDANVLIFERMREELAAGRSLISAIDAGYRHAMSTIVDSNLTTFIAGIILFSFGTGPVKGFAVTLIVGILTSFFSAVMVTRLLVVAWLRKTKPTTLPM